MSDAVVLLSGVHRSYGDVHAVRGVDLTIQPGETVALLGPNGAGKSTTIDIILGLSDPDQGSLQVLGGTPRNAVRDGQVAGMLQTGALVRETTVRELVGLFAAMYPRSLGVHEALELTGLLDLADRRTDRMSGGQAQRVRFACAVVANASLLVLDEPTVALDVEARHAFWGTVRDQALSGKTVLFATHYLDEADTYADRVLLMGAGEVVADGPANTIKAMVGSRTIRATVAADPRVLANLPGVTRAEQRGDGAVLTCTDADAALRELLLRHPDAHDIEVRGASLDEAFLHLTRPRGEARG